MSLIVSDDQRFAYTVGADHHMVAYRISDAVRPLPPRPPPGSSTGSRRASHFSLLLNPRRATQKPPFHARTPS